MATAVAEGSASITATSGDQTGSADVTVTTLVGDLQVNSSTTGSNPDPNGYTVTVDGSQSQEIGVNGTVTFSDVAAGNHSVQLTGVASNCNVAGSNPRIVTVPVGGTAQSTFEVDCSDPPPSGGILVLKGGQSQIGGKFQQICVGSCNGNGASDVFVSGVEIDGSTLPAWPIGNNGLFYVQGGPSEANHNIRIENSVIHDTPNWQTSVDTEHHGCVTIKHGDGPMWIVGNEIYHCTAVFYFKYEWPGPIFVEDNYIHDSRAGNRIRASGVEFRNNVIVGVSPMLEDKSFDGVLERNTFVNAPFGWSRDNGHFSRNNVVFGDKYLRYNSGGSTQYPQSTSEDNCFIGPANMLAISRLNQGLTIAQWKAQGHDVNSPHLVETDIYKVFADPDNGDYTLIGEAAQVCAGKGAQ
jgi:hypothetical protein